MVYQGPSRACARCKQRHIKCDETRPSCRNCLKRQLPCPGYTPEPGIRFQDETSSTIHQAQQRERRPVRRKSGKDSPTIPRTPPEDSEAFALNFFFENYATLGRGSQSSRGLFESIQPIFQSAAKSSAMSAATSAVALTLTSDWHGRTNDAPLARRHLGKALSLLRASLNDPVLSLKDETMAAVLLLKFHDMLVASKNLKAVPEDHVNGAIALIKHRGLASFNTNISKRLLQYVRHTAIQLAIQRRTRLDLHADVWSDPESMLKTPCIDLDWISVDVANLRASAEVRRLLHLHPATVNLDEKHIRDIRSVREQAAKLEIRLSVWADSLSGRWRPVPVSDPRGVDPSIQAAGLYGRKCEVYPSAQITNIWNLYRSYCLLVLELLLRCETLLQHGQGNARSSSSTTKSHISHPPQSTDYARSFQYIVDDMCASVPFLLGNRTEAGTVEEFNLDFSSNEIRFLHHPDDGKLNNDNLEMDMFMTEEQRTKSLLAQGPWLLYEQLTQILKFVMSDTAEIGGPLLRPGQIEWIQTQTKRIMLIQRVEGKGKGPELRAKRSGSSIRTSTETVASSAGAGSGPFSSTLSISASASALLSPPLPTPASGSADVGANPSATDKQKGKMVKQEEGEEDPDEGV